MHAHTSLRPPATRWGGHALGDSLVERAKNGDLRAFEQLTERHLPTAYRLAVGIVGLDDARDVAQDAMVAAWRTLPTLRDVERFEPWLHTIVLNRARNALRARRRHPVVTLEDAHMSHLVGEPTAEVDLRMALESTLGLLTPEVREVFVLHYVLDKPLREVALALGMREGTVKSRLNAGLTTLRRRLTDRSL